MAAHPIPHAFDRGRSGFTLIELMIVVGIIAVLAGLLLPTVGWARTRAQQAACTSNLAQLGAATLIYATLEGGRLPASQNWGTSKPERSSAWFVQLPKLMSEKRINRPGTIFQCPAFSGAPPGLIRNEVAKSYKMNIELDRWRANGRGAYRHRPFYLNRISDAQQVVLFVDGITSGGAGQWGYAGPKQVDDVRHAGWAAILFADGHATGVHDVRTVRAGSDEVRWTSNDW
jgi:prepilin-type N-terminal cleavage/methylation domain-containing protein/prepilin-type processing-associated H-X9-DG protein